MKIGPLVRRLAGPWEPQLTDLYRRTFFDMADFALKIQKKLECAGQTPHRVLEIGCGEGAMLTKLSHLLPRSRFDGIDLCPSPGRQFRGDFERVTFTHQTAASFSSKNRHSVDLVLIVDVMHHVPYELRAGIWRAASDATTPSGTIIVKEWLKNWKPIHWLCFFSDRYITGDRIRFGSRREWLTELNRDLHEWDIVEEWPLSPWRNNHAFILKRRERSLP